MRARMLGFYFLYTDKLSCFLLMLNNLPAIYSHSNEEWLVAGFVVYCLSDDRLFFLT